MATRKVWFATNREYKKHRGKDVFGSGFNDEGPHIYRVGVATTTRKRNGLYSLENFKVHSETPQRQDVQGIARHAEQE